MPPGAVYVGRPSKWANPFVATRLVDGVAAEVARVFEEWLMHDSF